jgi:hypothetical protein
MSRAITHHDLPIVRESHALAGSHPGVEQGASGPGQSRAFEETSVLKDIEKFLSSNPYL